MQQLRKCLKKEKIKKKDNKIRNEYLWKCLEREKIEDKLANIRNK